MAKARAKQTKARPKAKAKVKAKPKAKANVKAKPKAKPKPKATKPKAKAKAVAVEREEQVDFFRSYGGKAPGPEERAEAVADSKQSPRYAEVKKRVLELFRSVYPGDETDEQILAIDPNDYDMDPSMFYECIEGVFNVPQDPNNEYFGGYGGKIETLIAFLAKHWDGEVREGDVEEE
jgi:hypothetical protein